MFDIAGPDWEASVHGHRQRHTSRCLLGAKRHERIDVRGAPR